MLPSEIHLSALAQQPYSAARAARAGAAILMGMFVASVCHAIEGQGIFLVEDSAGAIHLSDGRTRDIGKALLIVEDGAERAPDATQPQPVDRFDRQRGELDAIVRSAALSQRLDPELLHAVIGVESGYAPRAVSARGAQGLMQLMPPTAKEYGVTDVFDPRQNIMAGARHLRVLLDQFSQNTALALAAYNAGARAVWRHDRQVPPFSETAAYVPRVLGRYAALRLRAAAH
jgi:soluble lytic murein transglycosylase-like protein